MDVPFTAAQAWEAHFSLADIRRQIRHGDWVRLRRGVYAEAHAVADDAARRHALDLAALLRVLEFDARGDYLVRVAALPEAHRSRRYGVPVTTVARTVTDLARTTSFVDGVVVADSALRLGLTTPRELARVLSSCRRWPGVTRAREVVAFADPRSESVLESVSRVAMAGQGVPAPRTQVVIGPDRVDFLWDDVRVIGEADGLAKYESDGSRTTRDVVRAEKRREERLADAGFEVVRWGWDDAMRPQRLSLRLRAAFARGTERQRGCLAA